MEISITIEFFVKEVRHRPGNRPFVITSICMKAHDPVKEHNEGLLKLSDTRQACLCRFCNSGNGLPRFKCIADHYLPVNTSGSSCRNKEKNCKGARLIVSSWCAWCFVRYKTNKREMVKHDDLIPLLR
jgi:hypothetical protein